jgi:hypothetical protein
MESKLEQTVREREKVRYLSFSLGTLRGNYRGGRVPGVEQSLLKPVLKVLILVVHRFCEYPAHHGWF